MRRRGMTKRETSVGGRSSAVKVGSVIAVALIGGLVAFFAARALADEGDDAAEVGESTPEGLIIEELEEVPTLAPIEVPDPAQAGGVSASGEFVVGASGPSPEEAEPLEASQGTPLSEYVSVSEVPIAEIAETPILGDVADVPEAIASAENSVDDPEEAVLEESVDVGAEPLDDIEAPGGDRPDGLRFTDPCAGEDGGSETPEDCPDPGEPGTIMGTELALDWVPEMWVFTSFSPVPTDSESGSIARCDPQELPAGAQRLAIVTPNPATITLTWWVEGGEGMRQATLETSDAERARWDEWYENDAPDMGSLDVMQHCTAIPELSPGDVVHYDVHAVDDHGQEARRSDTFPDSTFVAFPEPIEPAAPRVRPPTKIYISGNEVIVDAAVRDGETIDVRAYPRTDEPVAGEPCEGTAEPPAGYGDFIRWRPTNRTEISDIRRNQGTYPYDRSYVATYWGGSRLDAGADYRLCVGSTVQSGRTFDRGSADVEAYDLSIANLRNVELKLTDISTQEPIPQGDLRISARPVERPLLVPSSGCVHRMGFGLLEAGTNEMGEVLCGRSRANLDVRRRGLVVDITFNDPIQGELTTSARITPQITCSGTCEPLETEQYRIEIPAAQRPAGLCSPGLFESDCEPPTAETVIGSVGLELRYLDNPPGPGGTSLLGPVDQLGDQRTMPEEPQLDRHVASTPTGSKTEPGRRFEIVADRPVTYRATLRPGRGAGAEEPTLCVHDPNVVDLGSEDLSDTHTLDFEGLCAWQDYFMDLWITDEDGDTTYWTYPDTLGARPWLQAYFKTEAVQVRTDAHMEINLPNAAGGMIDTADMTVGSDGVGFLQGLTGCGHPYRSVNGSSSRSSVDETVQIIAEVSARGVRGSTDGGTTTQCLFTNSDGRPTWQGGTVRLYAEIPLAEALAADEIVLSSTEDDPFFVQVTADISLTS